MVHTLPCSDRGIDTAGRSCAWSIYMNSEKQQETARLDLVNSILKAARILDVLTEAGPLTFTEIFRKAQLPKSTLFKILATLEEKNIVSRDPESGRYRLGMKLIEWGGGARSQIEMRNIARPIMRKLNEQVDCTVHLTVIAHNEILPIESVESGNWYWHHFRYPVAIGIPAPMHATGAGKAILAFLKPEEIREILQETGLKRYTANTITNESDLWKEIEAIREIGYAVSEAEHDELIRSVASPIRDQDGTVVAALSALGVVSRFTSERIPDVAGLVRSSADEISRLMGYRKDPSGNGSSR